MRDCLGVEPGAVLLREDLARVLPGVAPLRALLLLAAVMRPARRGNQATDALDTLHTDLADDTHAQAHFSALGELIEVTAQTAPANLRAELQAASEAFARARHSESSTP